MLPRETERREPHSMNSGNEGETGTKGAWNAAPSTSERGHVLSSRRRYFLGVTDSMSSNGERSERRQGAGGGVQNNKAREYEFSQLA